MKKVLLAFLGIITFDLAAQVTVNCPSNLIYIQSSPLSKFDPSLPVSASNPTSIGIPKSGMGLALL
jgi:hypothetical protein